MDLNAKQRRLIVFAAWVGVILISAAHYATGPRIELYSFYLAPILIVTWFVNVRLGTVTALLSIFSWMSVDYGMDLIWLTDVTLLVNQLVRLGMYMLLVMVVWQWRKTLDREAALARLDILTQLPNRRSFFEQAQIELERARRYARPVTAIMMDLDNFKAVNDRMGHQAGDDLLRAISSALRRVSRSSDVLGRLGGDEFAIVLPETDRAAAEAFAEKLRREVLAAMQQRQWPVTVSLGVATFLAMPPDVAQLLKPADDLMYQVKQEGKNRVKQVVIEAPAS